MGEVKTMYRVSEKSREPPSSNRNACVVLLFWFEHRLIDTA